MPLRDKHRHPAMRYPNPAHMTTAFSFQNQKRAGEGSAPLQLRGSCVTAFFCHPEQAQATPGVRARRRTPIMFPPPLGQQGVLTMHCFSLVLSCTPAAPIASPLHDKKTPGP